ncbi:hypothetical protein SAMN05444972_10799 [Marininema halotolerans]|uniref:Uncharacterized protein n=1 Tax=Marininema halotolerans TaxID=1155944 RepID=A0A1I6SHL6_9BACL|nr:hypothetical protein SAMN05444972_10799 [Marininema halotolerans]
MGVPYSDNNVRGLLHVVYFLIHVFLTIVGVVFIYCGFKYHKGSEIMDVGDPIGEFIVLLLALLPWYVTKVFLIALGIVFLIYLNLKVYSG